MIHCDPTLPLLHESIFEQSENLSTARLKFNHAAKTVRATMYVRVYFASCRRVAIFDQRVIIEKVFSFSQIHQARGKERQPLPVEHFN